MFSRFFKKTAKTFEARSITVTDFPDISPHLPEKDGFCHPDWREISKLVTKSVPESDWNICWTRIAQRWLEENRNRLGGDYKVYETQNFLVLSASRQEVIDDAHDLFERSLKIILKSLPGVAATRGHGKRVVFMFANKDDYYSYISHFYAEGEHPGSGGVCLTGRGYTHFALPVTDYQSYRSTLVHELTHACLAHLPLPRWLDEAIAMRMEEIARHSPHLDLDRETHGKHSRLWNPESIQLFWSGKSWSIPGDSFELSYGLATILWRKIEIDLGASHESILKFLTAADLEDAGEAACQSCFEVSLADLVEDFLGQGKWTPAPETWLKPPEDPPLPFRIQSTRAAG